VALGQRILDVDEERKKCPAVIASGRGDRIRLDRRMRLVAAQVDLPRLSNLYPTGTRPFEYTNALSFTVTTTDAIFPPGGIKVNLDGSDVSSGLVIAGSASSNNVIYPGLLPNAIHTAIITVTNSLNHGISVTNYFDTFSQGNYMVEAEDFDYDGGQYVGSWYPEAYLALGAITLQAQDIHHSMFNETPVLLNPARAGVPFDARICQNDWWCFPK
jgi:hypothetical protein